jgi:site-specific recombinase XerD
MRDYVAYSIGQVGEGRIDVDRHDISAFRHLHGKGRKQRTVPLWRSTVRQIRAWLRINPQLQPRSALLPNRNGKAMTRGNVTQRLALAVKAATVAEPQLAKHRISPHIIRHTTAMHLLQAGVDISVIAMWLGHESPTTTHQYVEADLAMKEQALGRLQEPHTAIKRYKAPDSLIEFLKSL